MTDNSLHFSNLISNASAKKKQSDDDVATIREVVARYPWFTSARLLKMLCTDECDDTLKLHFEAYPRPNMIMNNLSLEELGIKKRTTVDATEIIERFLQKSKHKIVPNSSTAEDDVAARSNNLDLSDDLISEELAEIYLSQGLNIQSKQIYERLSLLNPEKSIYFAEIIAGINPENIDTNE